ncbi:SDR family NAD(P)-dependent oxidoreductase [Acidocella sp.]|uniref:SDR family NAD(P)-dependent oxidoreductase n=1 Tax=Acidocella sp. TaxID=50710 RepID=UPI0026083919|nr:SDR family oxidoreductase [Acidocella sp.]
MTRISGVAIITGAAGGIGSACVAELAKAGWPLILCDISLPRLEATAASLLAAGHPVELLAGDLSEPAYLARLDAMIASRPVGAVVHTAGLTPTMADAARIMAVNYGVSVRLVDLVRPKMAEGGCVVLTASSSAYLVSSPEIDAAIAALTSDDASTLMPFAVTPEMAYPISKRAVIRLVGREAESFGARNARIVSISPGLIDTAAARTEAAASPQMEMMKQKTPLRRFGAPAEIATVAAFLCSPAASFVSGRDIPVDGGMLVALGR